MSGLSRRYDEGLAQLKKTAEMDPSFPSAYSALATAYRLMGKYAESVESYAKLQELNAGHKPQHWLGPALPRAVGKASCVT
jgi:tetratricopeptide (TPR) repeat protein